MSLIEAREKGEIEGEGKREGEFDRAKGGGRNRGRRREFDRAKGRGRIRGRGREGG